LSVIYPAIQLFFCSALSNGACGSNYTKRV